MQPKQDTPIPGEDNNTSRNFRPHEDEESTLKKQDIEGDYKNLVGERSDIESRAKNGLLGHTPQAGLLGSESSASLREVRFSDQEFAIGTLISNIKYNHLAFQNNNPFYSFYNQLNYGLAKYFAESETSKSNVDKFLSEPLIALLTDKLSYRNANEWIEKLSEIPCGIPNNNWIKYKFEHQSGVARMARLEMPIHSPNVIGCLKFLIGYPGFWHNQTNEPSRIYNENDQRVYNEMYTSE